MSSTIPTFHPLCPLPLTKGGAFKTLYKDGNKFKVFQEWVRDFDAISYSKGETYKVSPFFVSGVIPDHIYIPPQPLLWQRRGLCGREYYMLAGYALQEGGKANCLAI